MLAPCVLCTVENTNPSVKTIKNVSSPSLVRDYVVKDDRVTALTMIRKGLSLAELSFRHTKLNNVSYIIGQAE